MTEDTPHQKRPLGCSPDAIKQVPALLWHCLHRPPLLPALHTGSQGAACARRADGDARPPDTPPRRPLARLFVGNIPKAYTQRQLTSIFAAHGCVIDLRLHTDRLTRSSQGSAFLW
jgi:hypothetical protein